MQWFSGNHSASVGMIIVYVNIAYEPTLLAAFIMWKQRSEYTMSNAQINISRGQ